MGRILDENGRLFGAINIIDALVVLVVLAVAGASIGLVWGGDNGPDDGGPTVGSQTESVTLTVQSSEVQPYVADAVPASGPVEDGNVSRIQNVSITPAEVVVPDDSGELHLRDHPRLKRVEMRVVLNATRTDGELQFGRQSIRIGRQITLDLGEVHLGGEVTRIQNSD